MSGLQRNWNLHYLTAGKGFMLILHWLSHPLKKFAPEASVQLLNAQEHA